MFKQILFSVMLLSFGTTLPMIKAQQTAQDKALACRMQQKTYAGDTALHIAAELGEVGRVQELLQAGFEVDTPNALGETALHAAKTKEVAQALLDCDANLDACEKNGWLPLHTAVFLNRTPVVELLLAHKAKVDARTLDDGSSALHIAAAGGYEECLALLLGAGASPFIKDTEGYTPFGVAIQFNTTDRANPLLKAMESHLPVLSLNNQRTAWFLVHSYGWDYQKIKNAADKDKEWKEWFAKLPE